MSADYYFDWRFRTDSDYEFAIRVAATVEWGQWNEQLGRWEYVAETPVSTVVSIANYWQ